MQLPDMDKPEAAAREVRLVYADGSARTVYVTETEEPFPEGRLIVSRTDLQGIITNANDAFVEMSGWAREDLIGAPQNILRHPDIPKVMALRLGARGFINKPFTDQELRAALLDVADTSA